MVWLAVLGAGHGAIGSSSGLVTLEVVGLRRQAEALSLTLLATGVITLLVGPLAGVHLSFFKGYCKHPNLTPTSLLDMFITLFSFNHSQLHLRDGVHTYSHSSNCSEAVHAALR